MSRMRRHTTQQKSASLSLAFKVFLPWNGVVGLRYPALDGEVVLDTRSSTSAFAATYEPSKMRVTPDPKLGSKEPSSSLKDIKAVGSTAF